MYKNITLIFLGLILFFSRNIHAQQDTHYEHAYQAIDSLLQNVHSRSFKQAVFVVENAYLSGTLEYQSFDDYIRIITALVQRIKEKNILTEDYKKNYTDLEKIKSGAAIFRLFHDTISAHDQGVITLHLPMSYNFEDIFGDEDWTNTFVTRLITTHAGNCHSLHYLYKIIANELGFETYLALAPNHIYIKTHSQQYGWFNIELTNGTFPTDAWLMTSNYVTMDAIRSGIYI